MSEHLIIQRRKEEQRRDDGLASIKNNKIIMENSRFESKTNLKIAKNKIMATYKGYQQENVDLLVERKMKLKELLESDEVEYRQELIDQEETKEERISRMKERVNDLKAKREEERLEVVEQLLLRKWRNENEDLKHMKTKLTEKRVAASRGVQLEEKREVKRQDLQGIHFFNKRNLEKKRYDELYELDRQKKIAREESDLEKRRDLNQDMMKRLTDQLESLRMQEMEEKILIEKDGRIMVGSITS
jgi:hypothetical protein